GGDVQRRDRQLNGDRCIDGVGTRGSEKRSSDRARSHDVPAGKNDRRRVEGKENVYVRRCGSDRPAVVSRGGRERDKEDDEKREGKGLRGHISRNTETMIATSRGRVK